MNTIRRETFSGQAVLVVFMLFTLMPLVSMLSTALQSAGTIPTGLSWPSEPQWHNFVDAFNIANLGALLWSSVLIVLGVVPVSLLIATMAGYGLGVLRMRGGRQCSCCCCSVSPFPSSP